MKEITPQIMRCFAGTCPGVFDLGNGDLRIVGNDEETGEERAIIIGRAYLALIDWTETEARPAEPINRFATVSETVFCPLSEREMQTLRMMAEGLNAKKMARRMDISHRTVEIHRQRVVKKVQALNIVHAVVLAREMGLIQ